MEQRYVIPTRSLAAVALAGQWRVADGYRVLRDRARILLLALLIQRAVQGARVVPVLLALAGVNMGGLITVVLAIAAMVIAGFSFRTSPVWRSFSRATLVWSGCATVPFFLMFVLAGMRSFGVGREFWWRRGFRGCWWWRGER